MPDNYLYFNSVFLRRNKIQEVRAEFSYKPDGREIKQSHREEVYGIDSLGRLVSQEQRSVLFGLGTTDTVSYEINYNIQNQPLRVEKRIKNERSAHIYQHDGLNFILHQYVTQTADSTPWLIIYQESLRRELGKKNTLAWYTQNELKKDYQKEVYVRDSTGTLVEYSRVLLFNNTGERFVYLYDHLGRLTQERGFALPSERETYLKTYLYDQTNLIQEDLWEEGSLVSKKEFVYRENLLLDAILYRDERLKSIQIIRFSYSFFE